MNKALFIIDVQKGFINKFTEHIPSNIEKILPDYKFLIVKKFRNKKNSLFVRNIGWDKMMEGDHLDLAFDVSNFKGEFHSKFLCRYSGVNRKCLKLLRKNKITDVYLGGISTRSCVLATAYALFDEGFNVHILPHICGSTSGEEEHLLGLDFLKRDIDKSIKI